MIPLFGGWLVDRVGVRPMTLLLMCLSTLGQVGFTIGTTIKAWPMMWGARSLFGAGTESLGVAQRILLAQWFMGKELALSMGCLLAFGRFGSVINDLVSSQFESPVTAYWVGSAACAYYLL